MLWQVHEHHIAKSDFPRFPDVCNPLLIFLGTIPPYIISDGLGATQYIIIFSGYYATLFLIYPLGYYASQSFYWVCNPVVFLILCNRLFGYFTSWDFSMKPCILFCHGRIYCFLFMPNHPIQQYLQAWKPYKRSLGHSVYSNLFCIFLSSRH